MTIQLPNPKNYENYDEYIEDCIDEAKEAGAEYWEETYNKFNV